MGDIFSIEREKNHIKIKCKETKKIEEVSIEAGKVFYIS
jgi:hypothetical protein